MRFAPNWKLTLFALIFLPMLVALGSWQLRRAEEKRGIEAALAEAASRNVRALSADEQTPPAHLTPVRVSGRLDAEHLVFLDNRTHQGRVGYELWAVLEDAATDGAFLVGLGWLPAPARREALPTVRLPDGPVTLHGVVLTERPETPVFGPVTESRRWPLRVQRLEPAALARSLGLTLYGWPIVVDAGEPGVQIHVFDPVRMGSATHTGYAVQWFGLAAVLLVGWCIASLRRTDPASRLTIEERPGTNEGRDT
ncbi:MAG: SURF1 family protein [Pseudomonadales bacterium]|jgi:cytochrome oxidase assembly protein ShyY1|nr:SURF1 family protein [Pseudomonadales bacterium]